MNEFLNSIYDEFIKDINISNLLIISIISILLLYNLYKLYINDDILDKLYTNDDISDKYSEIKQCMNKYDINEIYEFPNFLSEEECNNIIKLSNGKLNRSRVINDSEKQGVSEVRTSTNTFLDNEEPLMKKIDDKIYDIIGINKNNYEKLQVVNYKPGQFYKAHWDACDPNKDPRCINDVKKGGLRFATFIIYLNDDMKGGETEFPLINKKIKPELGKGVLFFNLNEDLKGRRELSKHAGLPPETGEKWMCNKWIRLEKFID